MTESVQTELLTLKDIARDQYRFIIPSYQRPYLWPDEEVLKLFSDIREAYKAGEQHYFIGTVLTARHPEQAIYELIDGQQRTTTLMLLVLAYRMAKVDCELAQVAAFNGEPRLQFEIRESVQHLLGSLAGLDKYSNPGREAIENDPYLTRIYAALKVLKQQVASIESEEQLALAEFIYTKVQWVNNIVSEEMDLNRLFSKLNTTSVQLEPVDLLKAKLFKKIRSDKALYDAIWLACEHTGNYFERNLRKVFPNADWNSLEYRDLAKFDERYFVNANEGEEKDLEGLSISELAKAIASENETVEGIENTSEPEEYDLDEQVVYCRSIVSFELLLIHALRVSYAKLCLDDIEPRLKSGNLLGIFEPLIESGEPEIKAFILMLWEVRYQFDTWVVKWVEKDDANEHQLGLTYQSRSLSGKKYYINRSAKETGDLVQLQAVRNFTGERSAQYWLTPFLAKLIERKTENEAEALDILEDIDNQLSLTQGMTQKEASFALAKGQEVSAHSWQEQSSYFEKSRGTAFEHYWFQKLEYLLWKQASKDDAKVKRFRITSKNSVEHVHPQHEEYNNRLEDDALHAFGNLVLLSPGENSSYGSQAVSKKKADFDSKPVYDSLKLKAIFELKGDREWGTDTIQEHQESMMSVFKKHYEGSSMG